MIACGASQRGRAATLGLTDTGQQRLRDGLTAIAELDESAFGETSSPARRKLRDALTVVAAEMRDG